MPTLLLTGSVGIASGYACSHIPWNLRDVVNATVALVRNPKLTDTALAAKFVNPPEPPSGGRVTRDNGVRSALLTGRGQVTTYGEWETEDSLPWGKRSTRPALIVTRLASGSSEKFLERVRELADAEKLPGLIDAADQSSRDGIRIVLVTKTLNDRDRLLGTLIHSGTGLRYSHSVNATAVGRDGKPRTVGVRESIQTWYEARVTYLTTYHKNEAGRIRLDLERLNTTLTVLNDLDRFLKTVRSAKDKSDAVSKVSKIWKISADMAKHVIGIPISTLVNTEQADIRTRCDDLSSQITTLDSLSTSGVAIDDYICSQISSLRPLCGPTRSVWMSESIPVATTVTKPVTGRDRMVEEAKALGISARAFNQWVLENTGTGKLTDKWSEYKLDHTHRLQMTTRDGKKQRRSELDKIRSDAEARNLPRRGQYAWNAFISTCENCRIDIIRAKMVEWLLKLPTSPVSRANSNPDQPKPTAHRTSRTGSPKTSRDK